MQGFEEVRCPNCQGAGGTQDHGCPTCRGRGATCPGCRGVGWTSKPVSSQSVELVRCATCGGDRERAEEAIRRVMRGHAA